MERHEAPTGLEIAGLLAIVTLTGVAVASLLLAWVGAHEGVTALVVGLTAGLATAAVVLRRGRRWRVAPWSWTDAGLLAAVLVVAAVQFFPGFPLAAKNRDPGVYVNHAVAIADQGSDRLEDPVFDTGAEVVIEDGEAQIATSEGDVAWRGRAYRSFPTDPDRPEQIEPDFFHLWPTTLATAMDLGGRGGLFNVTPFLAVVAVALLWLATRRAFGRVAATVAGGLLAVNVLQVWQAKYPSAEVLAELLYAGALLAVVLALSTRWRLAAGLGGLLVGLGFVARPDGIIVVGLAAAALAVLWAVTPGRRLGWGDPFVLFGLGLVPPLLVGAYQAYGRASRYAAAQEGLPSLAGATAAFALLVVGAVGLRLLTTRVPAVVRRVHEVDRPKVFRVVGYAFAAGLAAFLVLAWLRPQLLGENYRINKQGDRTRGYDELNLRRLAIFLTPVALVASVGAVVVGVRDRWPAARWVLVVPGLLIAPVLVWEPHIAPDLMWWTRRYVPMVVPTFLVLLGVMAAWLWARRDHRLLLRLATAAVVLGIGVVTLRQTADVRDHREFDGSLQVIDALDEAVAADGVVVWLGESSQVANFAITPFTWLGLPALAGPPNPTAAGLDALQEQLDDRPLYLVTDGQLLTLDLAARLEVAGRITGELSEFERGFTRRPRQERPVPVDLTVWRLTDA